MQIILGKILKTLFKVLLYLLSSIIAILILVLIFLHTEKGQDIARKEAIGYLSKKLGTSVTISRFRTDLLSYIEIQGIRLEDQSQEVLLNVGKIEIKYRLSALLNNTLSVSRISIDTIDFRMARNETDTAFNFDFIIHAFSAPPPPETIKDTSGRPLKFDFGSLTINQLHYVMDDKKGRQFYDATSELLNITVGEFDPENQLFKIINLETKGLTAKIDAGSSPTDTAQSGNNGLLPRIIINQISLLDNSFAIQLPGSGYQSETYIRNFQAENMNLDLNTNKMSLQKVLLARHQSRVLIKPSEARLTTDKKLVPTASESEPFSFAIGSFQLQDNDLKYDMGDEAKKASPDFDTQHIHLQDLQLQLNNFALEGTTLIGTIKQLQFREKCGLDIQQLTTAFHYSDTGVILDQFRLKTASTTIVGNYRISYESLDQVSKDPGLLGFDINLKETVLAAGDMKYFRKMAGNDPEIRKLLTHKISLEGILAGKVSDMTVDNLKLKMDEITLSASGKVKGLPDPNQVQASIALHQFSGTIKSLSELLPKGSIPPNIAANESFRLKGKLGDNKGVYSFRLKLNSSAGDLSLDGKVKQLMGVDKLLYDVHAESAGIQLDKILMDTLFGKTAFNVHAAGKGISPETADAQVLVTIPEVFYKGYQYQNIDLSAAIAAWLMKADLKIRDSAIAGELLANYSFDSIHPLLTTQAHIENLDLRRLGFITDTLKFKADITADLTNVNAKHINGTILIPNMEITKGQDILILDSISLNAVNEDSTQAIVVKSPFLNMSLEGYYEIDVLPAVAQNLLFDFLTVYPPTGTIFRPAYAKLEGELLYHPFIKAFVPGLSFTKNIQFGSIVSTAEKDLMFIIDVPSATYNDFIIDSTILGIHTVNDTMQFGLYSSGIRNSSVALNHTEIEGNARDGNINWNVKLFNRNDSLTYDLTGIIINDTSEFLLQLAEEQIINSEKWKTNTGNKTEYTTSQHIQTNLALSSGYRQIVLQSSGSENGLPLDLKLVDFPITTLTKIIAEDTTLASGTINGTARLNSIEPLLFAADFKIDSLRAYEINVGNLTVAAKNERGTGYSAKLNLLDDEIELDLQASYSDNGILNGNLDIKKFDTRTLNPFLNPMISRLKGFISGNVAFEGTIEKPVLEGELNLRDIEGNYKAYNTFFRIPEGKMSLNRSGIELSEIVIYDSLGNTARLNGNVQTHDYRNYTYDLGIKTDHFMALGKKLTPEQDYYGPAYFTSNIRISSSGDILMVRGNVKADEKSVLNVEMGSVDTTIATNNGIIVYVDSLQSADSLVIKAIESELSKSAPSLKLGLALNLEMTKTSRLNIYLDQTGGDFMKIAGDANLTVSQQPGGKMDMQGKFTIDNGEYQMTLSRIIKRKFIVEKGSFIQWSGSPTDASIDLTALYNVETTAEAILAGSQTTNKGAYKQNLPFEVYLLLKKKLLQPDISFKLDMPEKEQNAFSGVVYSRIKQINLDESELNKQVMGLLMLNQFIPEDPLASGSGSFTLFDYESAARSTAGAIVSSQLNSLISSKIKKVDIDFDVDSKADYSSGEKSNTTDLNVNMSRSLFNDRYTISVGSTFALEGSEEHKKNAAGLAGNYSAEYKITRDGRYRAKAYRKDQYEADNSGQVIQTGVSFILFIDFNKYREIFKKKKSLDIK